MPQSTPMLHLLCGKIAAGKSTLAARLSEPADAVLIAEDDWLKALFGDVLKTGADYLRYSGRLQTVMAPHVVGLLDAGVSVVLDFPANTVAQRAWMKRIIAQSGADHTLHLLDVPDAVCLDRLRARNANGEHAFAATEAQFRQFTRHFAPPTPDEGFTIVRH